MRKFTQWPKGTLPIPTKPDTVCLCGHKQNLHKNLAKYGYDIICLVCDNECFAGE